MNVNDNDSDNETNDFDNDPFLPGLSQDTADFLNFETNGFLESVNGVSILENRNVIVDAQDSLSDAASILESIEGEIGTRNSELGTRNSETLIGTGRRVKWSNPAPTVPDPDEPIVDRVLQRVAPFRHVPR